MSTPPQTPSAFLPPDATAAQMVRAVAANHREWFTAMALASGGEVHREKGLTRIDSPGEVILAFPQASRATTGTMLDEIVADCRRRRPGQVSCWSLAPARPRDLGARLAARGFEWGWKPHWMGLNLDNIRTDIPFPDDLHIAVDDASDWEVDDLPYYRRDAAANLQILARAQPRRLWHFGAWLRGKIVGHSLLYITTGRLGVAGIYSVGVVPAARRQGIGKAVTLAACRFAHSLGCHHALLNSAATELYEQIGFTSLGWGQTWWMHAPTLAAPPPTAAQIAFAEAVGRGDIAALNALRDQRMLPDDLDAPMPNGMTPMEMAIQPRKAASARWLVVHGATLDVIHAWDLGWKKRVPRLLAASPEQINRRSRNGGLTPLHEAVGRGDVELVRILLAAHPDLQILDTQFNSTPLGWARHLQRTEIIALIEQYQASVAT